MASRIIYEYKTYEVHEFIDRFDQSKVKPWIRDIREFLLEWLGGIDRFNIQTSGSTGQPKTIEVSRRDMIKSARYTADFLDLMPGMMALCCLPARYIAGKMMLVRGMELNLDIILCEPSANPIKNLEEKPEFAAFTPHQVKTILERDDTKNKFGEIRKVIIGGGVLNFEDELKEFANEIYLTFGMTETLSHIAMRKVGESENFRTISEDFKISQGKDNCLIIKTPYSHAKELQTNDIVEIINERTFQWIGRKDNVVNSGGIKLYPEKLERLLNPLIDQPFFLTGISDKKLGKKLVMVIESSEDENFRNDILSRISTVLKGVEMPRSLIFIPQFVYTKTGKIQREETRLLLQ